MDNLQWWGPAIGLASFLIIGIFHPLVIKGEYNFGQRCKLWFGIAGGALLTASLLVDNVILSILLGVTAFSCFWSIKEVKEQKERVERGWFPRNPHRKCD